MAVGGVRWAPILLVPAALAGLAGVVGCTGSGSTNGSPATAGATATSSAGATGTAAASVGKDLISATKLKGALLTRVNGVARIEPASTGPYDATAKSSTGTPSTSGVVVTPKACATAAQSGFDVAALAGLPAAAAGFHVGKDAVSEVLISSSTSSAETALAGHVPAECSRYQETVNGKTLTYGIRETAVSGIGKQAKALNVQANGNISDALWSLIYQGEGFVGTVTVVGPDASEQAVTELGEKAYSFAVKSLS